MSKAFRDHFKDGIDAALNRSLNEYDNITYTEIVGVLEMFQLGVFQTYLEASKDGGKKEVGFERLGETPTIPDGCGEGRDGIEGSVPPSEPNSETPPSDTQPEGCS